MKPAPPLIPQAKLDALIAFALAWLGWLLTIIAKLGAPSKSRTLRRFVERLERYVEITIFVMAAKTLNVRHRPRQRPPSIPAGFRRTRFHRRLLFKHARIADRRASLHARVTRLHAALINPDRYIARFHARIRRGLRASALIACAPRAQACASLAHTPCAYADTS